MRAADDKKDCPLPTCHGVLEVVKSLTGNLPNGNEAGQLASLKLHCMYMLTAPIDNCSNVRPLNKKRLFKHVK